MQLPVWLAIGGAVGQLDKRRHCTVLGGADSTATMGLKTEIWHPDNRCKHAGVVGPLPSEQREQGVPRP